MTDVGFLIVFYIFVIGMIGVSVYGWKKGNVDELVAPSPTEFKVFCGYREALEFPYLFFGQTNDLNHIKSYCVKACPTNQDSIEVFVNGNSSLQNTVEGYKTKTIGAYCFPDDDKISEDFINKIYESNG